MSTCRRSPIASTPTSRRSSTRSKVLEIQPQVMTNGAAALIEEAAQTKITGEEERYSGTDLVTLQANVDGAKEVFDLVSPLLVTSTSSSTTTSRRSSRGAGRSLDEYRTSDGLRALQRGERGRPRQAQDVDGRAERAAEPGLGVARPAGQRVGRCALAWLLAAPAPRRGGRGHGRRRLRAARCSRRAGRRAPGDSRPAELPRVDRRRGSRSRARTRAGITTPSQRHAIVAAFDMTAADRGELVEMFQAATTETRALMAGEVARGAQQAAAATRQPDRRCRAAARRPHDHLRRRCVAVRRSVRARATRSPASSSRMPAFPNDDPAADQSHGDLLVQVCAATPEGCNHALRRVMRVTRDVAHVAVDAARASRSRTRSAPDARRSAT